MTWRIVATENFAKQLRKLDRQVARRVAENLNEAVASGDPRSRGHALTGPLVGLWRYRVGHLSVLCEITDAELVVLALEVSARDRIYR